VGGHAEDPAAFGTEPLVDSVELADELPVHSLLGHAEAEVEAVRRAPALLQQALVMVGAARQG